MKIISFIIIAPTILGLYNILSGNITIVEIVMAIALASFSLGMLCGLFIETIIDYIKKMKGE